MLCYIMLLFYVRSILTEKEAAKLWKDITSNNLIKQLSFEDMHQSDKYVLDYLDYIV